MTDLIGLCLFHRVTGEHRGHVFFSPSELEMPGYVETIEKSYEGTFWVPVRVYCAKPPENDVRGLHEPERMAGPDEGSGPSTA